uniref:G-protein coupled receptors family 1 profile domain-containing protein n=1 Tax=Ditylenchus dipsaci TaxID=166011 RepID=A0A915D2P4_9BILA
MSEAENLSLVVDAHFHKDWPLLGLAVVPLACILGNSLVIAAVWTTKSLQTPTNYLLVSLACADLLIGVAVMPFNIYMSVNGLHWHLPAVTCYIYCVLDHGQACRSHQPAEYKTPKHKRRVYIAIGLTWVFSVCLSLPLVTGFNDATRYFLLHEHHCGIYSPYYMLCSSIFAFYLPCLIMSITYGFIFYTLKRDLDLFNFKKWLEASS